MIGRADQVAVGLQIANVFVDGRAKQGISNGILDLRPVDLGGQGEISVDIIKTHFPVLRFLAFQIRIVLGAVNLEGIVGARAPKGFRVTGPQGQAAQHFPGNVGIGANVIRTEAFIVVVVQVVIVIAHARTQ